MDITKNCKIAQDSRKKVCVFTSGLLQAKRAAVRTSTMDNKELQILWLERKANKTSKQMSLPYYLIIICS